MRWRKYFSIKMGVGENAILSIIIRWSKTRFEENKAEIPLLLHEDWLAVRNDACFENEGQTIITHGGSHFMEMVIPFVKIERNP